MFLEVGGGDRHPAVDEGVLVHRVTSEDLVAGAFTGHGGAGSWALLQAWHDPGEAQ